MASPLIGEWMICAVESAPPDRQRLLDRPRHMREPARYRTVTGAPRVVPDRARNRQTPSRALAGLRSLCSVSMLGLGDGWYFFSTERHSIQRRELHMPIYDTPGFGGSEPPSGLLTNRTTTTNRRHGAHSRAPVEHRHAPACARVMPGRVSPASFGLRSTPDGQGARATRPGRSVSTEVSHLLMRNRGTLCKLRGQAHRRFSYFWAPRRLTN